MEGAVSFSFRAMDLVDLRRQLRSVCDAAMSARLCADAETGCAITIPYVECRPWAAVPSPLRASVEAIAATALGGLSPDKADERFRFLVPDSVIDVMARKLVARHVPYHVFSYTAQAIVFTPSTTL